MPEFLGPFEFGQVARVFPLAEHRAGLGALFGETP